MIEMKSGEVVLSLAAQLASWRAVLVRTWATCKPWQRKEFHQYSMFLANCLNQSQQTVWESAGGGAAATDSRKVGKGRLKRGYADVDGLGAKPEPDLGLRGPTLKKQSKQIVLESAGGATAIESKKVRKGWLKRRYADVDGPGARPEPSVRVELEKETKKRPRRRAKSRMRKVLDPALELGPHSPEAMDPAGSPSSIPKVADTTRSSSSADAAATSPGWRSFFCLGNGK